MRTLALMIAVFACLTAQPALSCSRLPPGTPEEEARRLLDWQTDRMDWSSTIFLARVIDIESVPVRGAPFEGTRVTLEPLRSLKGEVPSQSFTLQHDAYTSCGLSPEWPALRGEVGDIYVVFATSSRVSQDYVFFTLSPDEIVVPALRDLLDR